MFFNRGLLVRETVNKFIKAWKLIWTNVPKSSEIYHVIVM